MAKTGWVAIYRQIQDHWLWKDKPFDKGRAWIDMLLLANHEEEKISYGNELITVERGCFLTSELKLSDRWGWSRTKVRAFLSLLEDDSMIVQKKDNKKTAITIVKYGDYASFENEKEQQKNIKKTSKKHQKNTNNNDNNDNNDNKDNITPARARAREEEFEGVDPRDEIFEYSKNIWLSDNQIDRLIEIMGDRKTFIIYVERLENFIKFKKATVKNCYQTILSWYTEDVCSGGKI